MFPTRLFWRNFGVGEAKAAVVSCISTCHLPPSPLLRVKKPISAPFSFARLHRRLLSYSSATFPFISVTLKMDTSSHIPRWSTKLKIYFQINPTVQKVPTVQTKWSICLKPQNSFLKYSLEKWKASQIKFQNVTLLHPLSSLEFL